MEHVTPPSAAEEELLAHIPLAEEKMKRQFGISGFVNGLSGVALLRKLLFEPTCTISGLIAGYTGAGSKTVMPARALAKLDIRLVPGLDPDLVDRLLRAHLDRRGFSDVQRATHRARAAPRPYRARQRDRPRHGRGGARAIRGAGPLPQRGRERPDGYAGRGSRHPHLVGRRDLVSGIARPRPQRERAARRLHPRHQVHRARLRPLQRGIRG